VRPGPTLVVIAAATAVVVIPVGVLTTVFVVAFADDVPWYRHVVVWLVCLVPTVVVGLFAGAMRRRDASAQRGDLGCLLAAVGTLLVLAPSWALWWTTQRGLDGSRPDPSGPWVAATIMTVAGVAHLALAHRLLFPRPAGSLGP
jgi:uncharacterized membrane protein